MTCENTGVSTDLRAAVTDAATPQDAPESVLHQVCAELVPAITQHVIEQAQARAEAVAPSTLTEWTQAAEQLVTLGPPQWSHDEDRAVSADICTNAAKGCLADVRAALAQQDTAAAEQAIEQGLEWLDRAAEELARLPAVRANHALRALHAADPREWEGSPVPV